jgi:hypothetical protein
MPVAPDQGACAFCSFWQDLSWGLRLVLGHDSSRRWKLLKKSMLFSLFTVLMLSACQGGNDDTAYDLRNDRTNPNYMSNRTSHNNYDEVRDITDKNPNFLNLKGTTQGDHSLRNNTGHDIDIARDIINRSDSFRADSIWISNSGDRMTVTVDRRGKLNNKERNYEIGHLQKKLTEALPRYSFDIRER